MSADLAAMRDLLEARLATIEPEIATGTENKKISPQAKVPYQVANVVFIRPQTLAHSGTCIQRGYLEVVLAYPLETETAAAVRAKLIRDAFPVHDKLISGDVKVKIMALAEIIPGFKHEDRWLVPVRVHFADR